MLALLSQGGVFMLPLLLGSTIALAIGIERAWMFSRLPSSGKPFRLELDEHLERQDLEGAQRLAAGLGPARACARAGLRYWNSSSELMDAAMGNEAKEHEPELYRFLGVLETIVTAAPLIGLLGTITGMMGVFKTVAAKLANDPHANTTGITAGIGEALIATAAGIFVAVLALFLHNIFQALAESRVAEADQTAEMLRLAHARSREKARG